MKNQLRLLPFLVLFLTACASMNDKMTPSVTVIKDQFDGSVIVRQEPVSAASSLSEGWHTLGFEWTQNHPDVVFLQVGVSGVTNVMGVAFNVDGEIIENISKASTLTKYGNWSTRRLVMSYADFEKVARGKDVKMKVMQIDEYSVSSFGAANSGAIVNSKFEPFLDELWKARNG
ncbi:MAG: hypothetical protein C9356_02570 [Oleiphilus sp.]|nr:MAG: hypothetical protein C9356_02570 [Oleiphilus sp.]